MKVKLSLLLPGVILTVILLAGVPLFLRMPLWCDPTLYDVCAFNLLKGGTHFRDTFDTNLPGMVWSQTLIRWIAGWSSEALRIVDLIIVGTITTLLCRWAKDGGAPGAAQLWLAATIALFYLFETQFIHCQRDVWMMLPILLSVQLHRRSLSRSSTHFLLHVLEGALWGIAVWYKPHAMVLALGITLLMGRFEIRPLLGLLLGGLIMGALGCGWLILSGTWSHFLDVFLNWNPEYLSWSFAALRYRLSLGFHYFAPFGLIHLIAVPVAIYSLGRRTHSRYHNTIPEENQDNERNRTYLAVLYLVWLTQAFLLQKTFRYVHVPTIFLALTFLTTLRFPVGPIFISWCFATALLHMSFDVPEAINQRWNNFGARHRWYDPVLAEHPILSSKRYQRWWQCVTGPSDPELKDDLGLEPPTFATTTLADLDRVGQYIRGLDLQDGDLICWDDSTHPLYVDLKLRPGIRYLHVSTAQLFRSKLHQMRMEIIASGHKYVVADLESLRQRNWKFAVPIEQENESKLPRDFPTKVKDVYPWNQEVVFRSGRYVVFRVTKPIQSIVTPYAPRGN